MRERLLGLLVGLTVAVIVLYGVPRAYMLVGDVEDREAGEVGQAATYLAALAGERLRAGGTVDRRLLDTGLTASDAVTYVAADGRRVEAGDAGARGADAVRAERRLADGGRVVVERDRAEVTRQAQQALLPLVLLGLALLVVSTVVAYVAAGRATAVVRRLAEAARDLGRGRFDLDVPRSGAPEVVAIGTALEGAAARLDQLVSREREFAVNASHQLRTPITALRLELEDLTYWEETDPRVAAQLRESIGELDRLSASIDDLLDLARRRRTGDDVRVDLPQFVADASARWRRRLAPEGRRVALRDDGPLVVRIPTGPVGQVLDVLVENAHLHGRGTITVETRAAADHVALRVADEGPRTFGAEVFDRGVTSRRADGTGAGTGVGLAVASELAESIGGRLTLDERSPTAAFVLRLPRQPEQPV